MYNHKQNNSKYDKEGIAALLPVYTDGIGDTTEVIENEGKRRIIDQKINSVIKHLLDHFSTDIASILEKYGDSITRKNKLPLPLSHNLILFPFKVRRPEVSGDPTYGYVNYKCIESYCSSGKHSKLILKNGVEIPLTQSLATTEHHIVSAKLLEKVMELQRYRKLLELEE